MYVAAADTLQEQRYITSVDGDVEVIPAGTTYYAGQITNKYRRPVLTLHEAELFPDPKGRVNNVKVGIFGTDEGFYRNGLWTNRRVIPVEVTITVKD